MSIQHKFLNTNFGNGFQTHNAILDVTPYKPEVMIIGTFNPDIPSNSVDFFYGRNYFWPLFENLFCHNSNVNSHRRMPTNGVAPVLLSPSLFRIFEISSKAKLTFADLISDILSNGNPLYDIEGNNVTYNDEIYNIIQDDNADGTKGLSNLDKYGQLNWNTEKIIEYLCDNPQIKYIYLTRQPTGVWGREWKKIINHKCMQNRLCTNIYTPSGRRLKKLSAPFNTLAWSLLHCWIWNGSPHAVPINKSTSGHLDQIWLINKRVNVNNF